MIVSILQLMGFPMGKPVHSRAGEAPPDHSSKSRRGTAGTTDHVQKPSARRQEVKATTGKSSKAGTASTKAPASGKPKAKPVAKPVAPAAKKPAAKVAATKAATSKPVAKSPAKPAAKVAAKTAKPAAKAVAPAKKVTAAKPTATKSATKPVAKPASKAATSKPAAPTPTPKAAAKPMPTTVSPKTKTPLETPPVEKMTSVPVAPAATAPKAGRPSSRLAQLTVPSMAQSVASTAAKASYAPSTPSPVIVPVLPASIKKDPKLANNWKTKAPGELTDAELMAMPDAEYMNTAQLAAFRLKLTKLKLDILNNAGETTEHLREDTSVVPDPADRATIEEEHALELRTRDRERKLLKKIEQSIARIDAGDYGYCDETGEPIGVGRLLARPTATLSLEAQQRRELKQKMFGD
jgi:DnaK suppressor protein